jgi:hypothetical protein
MAELQLKNNVSGSTEQKTPPEDMLIISDLTGKQSGRTIPISAKLISHH